MWPYFEELLKTPVPRYTSYPTAADFHAHIDSADMQAGLDAIGDDEPLSLYLHIPFCEKICWYCGCNTAKSNRADRLDAYLEALTAEIAVAGEKLGKRGKVRRIAFGGGSPNAIAPERFLGLVDALGKALDVVPDPIISVEVDPRSFTAAWADALRSAGVSRVSLGVQTLHDGIQKAIGRVQPEAMIANTMELLRSAGISSVNFDLMYGLPQQGIAELEDTLTRALAMQPDRIALFGYAHVPHIIPRQRQIGVVGLPDGRLRFEQAARGFALLTEAGYEPVGFDHFALPDDAIAVAQREGTLRRNFQGFTEDQAEILLGFGATSISMFPDRILQTEKNSGRYRMNVLSGRLPQNRGIIRSAEDRTRARIIENILCLGAADFAVLANRDALVDRFAPFVERGLMRIENYRLTLDPAALPYARTVAAAFDAYRELAPFRFSSAV